MKETDIIIRELTQEEVISRKPFSHFGWEGSGAFSFLTISDGYWESAKILLDKMEREYNNFAVVDTLVYPLFFNYRHSIETFLKLLFFNYGKQTDEARRKFLELGHDLQHLWQRLRPYLNHGKKHVGCSVNLNVVEHYIKSLNDFDPDSMVMRYPVEKDLVVNKKQEHHFDFIHFGNSMNSLCDALRQLNYELSNQMSEIASLEELNFYLNMVDKYRMQIEKFMLILKEEISNESTHVKGLCDIVSALNDGPSKTLCFLNECEPDLLILLDNLYYGGRSVKDHSVRLSCSLVSRQKEFVRFCNDLLQKDGLVFGEKPHEVQINILGKVPSSLLIGISTAISIIELKDVN